MARRRDNQNQAPTDDQSQTAAAHANPGQNMFMEFMNAMQATRPQVNNNAQMVEQFHRYKPPTWNGREDPAVVEEWFRSLERTFALIGCTDTQRVTCVAYQLIKDADHWWESYWRLRPVGEREVLTWDGFKEIVMDKYYPQSYRDQMESKFLELKQGGMTVADYERKFNRMCRFAAHLVDTERKKAQRFRKGLRPEIRNILAGHGDMSYELITSFEHRLRS